MSTTEIFLIAMLIIFSVPYVVWRVFRTEYYAPLVVVQIITGILLGPGVLGAAFPDYYKCVFNAPVIQLLNGIAWWAVMLFVWIAGIELDLRQAWIYRRESGITSGLALLLPLIFGCIAAAVMVSTPGWIGAKGMTWQFVLGVGMSCAVTALPILILFMEKLEILRQPIGQRILRWQPGEASLIGWLLQTKALIMIIFVNILLDKGVITSDMFTALLLMAVGSTMLSVPVATPKLRALGEMPPATH